MSEPRKYKRREVTPQEQARIDEVVRLLNVDGIVGRRIAARIGACYSDTNNYKQGYRIPTQNMCRRLLKDFAELAKELTPRVNNEEGD